MSILEDRIQHSLHIAAPPERVFSFFTDPRKHARWLGREATLDPRPGGIYRCEVNDTATVVGEYVEVDPPHRIVFTWGFDGDPVVPPGSSVVTVTLRPSEGGTDVLLVHTGLPHPMLSPHDQGWLGYLGSLRLACGRDVEDQSRAPTLR